jgi:hypothetical protein
MTTIMISIMPEGIPVDKMDGGDDGSSCPIATYDEEVNDVNKMYAQDEADYRDVEEDTSSDRYALPTTFATSGSRAALLQETPKDQKETFFNGGC